MSKKRLLKRLRQSTSQPRPCSLDITPEALRLGKAVAAAGYIRLGETLPSALLPPPH